MLIVYVDDIVITGDDIFGIAELKSFLATEFEIKDLRNLWYFLGIEVARSKKGIYISQRKYVIDLLREVGKLDCKPIETPIDPNHKLGVNDGDVLPNKVDRILAYLKGCPRKRILYPNHGHLKVNAYYDASWASSIDDRRSTSGYCILVGGNVVYWRSKKQLVVARSSAEAKYKEVGRHFIRERVASGEICLPYVRYEDQLADRLTKDVPKSKLINNLNKARHDKYLCSA
ncbi:PREDICTED: uncharacterized protein LOC109114032 [Nelumbo nucifera]|uniref:Uncharacterized protein LOC109114032 n=1 Tax=Nelumbo nucifera TaxID=4432 RepID=A0A1U8PYG0_NELNU|nr:PREDICTED: uncharacterized protein LOC109114032 [Nelumbo nucifera]